jgi:hypothetical protein
MLKRVMAVALPVVAVSALVGAAAQAEVLNASVSGNKVEAEIELAGGVNADLEISFEDVSNLSVANLGLSATLVNPADPALLSRLPSVLVAVPAGFPVLITIEPSGSSGFTFDGVASLEIYTKDLTYVAGSPLRLFSAKSGEAFADITHMIAGGSYRTRGGGGHYSEFLIVADTRPLQQAISGKFDAIDALLTSHAATLGAAQQAALSAQLTTARNAWLNADYDDAIDAIEDFDDDVADAADTAAISNTWSASGGAANVAGELRAAAKTLRFSLTLAANNL